MQVNVLALASFLAMVAGQAGVPACANQCIKVLPSECQQQDIACICGDNSFITNVSCCVYKNCAPSDQAAALQAAETLCGAGGVTLTVTGATCLSSSTSSSHSSSTTSAVAMTSSSSSGSSSASVTAIGSATTSGTTAGAVSGSSMTSTGASSAATGSTTTSTGVAPKITAMAGFIGAAAAAVALL